MFETRSTSSWPTASTSRVIRPAPIQVGMPKCCWRVQPAPASMMKPITNRVNVTDQSRNRKTTGWATLRNTL